jgi:hypothetical protein
MASKLTAALERLCSSGDSFEQALRVLTVNERRAVPTLLKLLGHQDPGWRRAAAGTWAAEENPASALPELLELLGSDDVTAKVAAIAALEWLPHDVRRLAVPAVVHVLISRPVMRPLFTRARAQVPRAIAAHFLGTHGGPRGLAALRRAARRRSDPMIHHIDAALERAGTNASKSTVPSNKRLRSIASGVTMRRRGVKSSVRR